MSTLRLLLCSFLILTVACRKGNEPIRGARQATATAPGGATRAYLTREFSDGGATGNTIHNVYLSGALEGPGIPVGELVFQGLHDCAIELEWRQASLLAVHYDGENCDIRRFQNYWYDPEEVEQQRYNRVEIVLEKK